MPEIFYVSEWDIRLLGRATLPQYGHHLSVVLMKLSAESVESITTMIVKYETKNVSNMFFDTHCIHMGL